MNIRTVVTATLVAVTGAGTSSASVVELVQPQSEQAMYTFSGHYRHNPGGYFNVSEMIFTCMICRTPKTGVDSTTGDCSPYPAKSFHVSATGGKVSAIGIDGNRKMTMRIGGYTSHDAEEIDYYGYILCGDPDGNTTVPYPYHTVRTWINASYGTFGPTTFAGPTNVVLQPELSSVKYLPTTEWSRTGSGLAMQVVDALTLKKGESKSVIRHTRGEGHATLYVDTTGVPGLQCQINGAATTGGLDLGPGDSLVCRNASGRLGVTEGTLNVTAAIR